MTNGIDYRYLKAFVLTAKYLNFSRAAQEMSIAQSAVSRQIKLLEESIGEQLIVRSSKKVLLTEKGKSLYRSITRFEEMTYELSKSSGPQLIKVGLLHGLMENWFIQVVKEFTSTSEHSLKIEADTPANLKEALFDGKLDMIFTSE
ncbi:MAG: LysR family transcriptional regulator, partial [Bacteriovoracaceae bacterium]